MYVLSSFKRLLLILAMVYWSDSNAEAGFPTLVTVNISGDGTTPAQGQNYSLTCNVSGANITSYQWTKNTVSLIETRSTLYFQPLRLSDAGLYTCVITINSTSYNSSVGITLQLPLPTLVTVTSDPVSPIQPFVFPHVTLTCTLELSPAVDVPVTVNTEWSLPTGFTTTNTAHPVMGSTTTYTSNISIGSFRRNPSGNYTCSATVRSASQFLNDSLHRSGREGITTGVYIYHNSSILINNSNIAINNIGTLSVIQDFEFIVVCTSDRMPCCRDNPQYGEWYFPNGSQVIHEIEGAVAFHRSRDNAGNVYLLRTSHTVLSPSGKFCCEVEDATGRNQTLCINICNSTCVHITDGVATPTLGQSYSLTCSVARASVTIYQWSKNDIALLNESGPILSFQSLSLSDSGLYTCAITMGSVLYNGSMKVTLQLPAFDSVTVTSDPVSPIRPVGSDVTLTCTVELSPAVDVPVTVNTEWTGPDGFMTTNTEEHHNGQNYTVSHKIHSFSRRKSGNYSCLVSYNSTHDDNVFIKGSDELSVSSTRVTVGVYISLNGSSYLNDSEIPITAIDITGPSNVLQCITDKMPCCYQPQLGHWLFPNGSQVPELDNATSFYINRSINDGTVNLNRLNDSVTPTGRFCCVLPDALEVDNTICVTVTEGDFDVTQATVTVSDGTQNKETLHITTVTENGRNLHSETEHHSDDNKPAIIGSIVVLILLTVGCVLMAVIVYVFVRKRKKKRDLSQCGLSDNMLIDSPLQTKSKPDATEQQEVIELKKSEAVDDNNISDEEDNPGHSVPLTEFVDYVDNMHTDKNTLFEKEFNSLRSVPKSCNSVSKLIVNREKNRFANIFPYDYNRVKLREIPDVEGSDYINASFLNGYEKQKAYIAAQGPLPNTVDDFWRMIWEQKLPTIVMLTKCFEDRRKCECYWPEKFEEPFSAGHDVTVKLISKIPFSEFVLRKMMVERESEPDTLPFEVTQLHFTAWPDHGVPDNTSVMLNIIRRVCKLHPYSDPRPLLVHCSAGVGRTGTFIALDSMLERMKTEESFNIFEFVTNLRKGRISMVQTLAQYMLIHDTLREFIMCGETEILAPKLDRTIDSFRQAKDGISGFEQQFQILDLLLSKTENDSFVTATEEYNADKNRYPDKIPYDGFSRIFLRWNGEQGSDYINASYINGYKQRRAYIATQGPLESTVNDFWRMVWEQQSCCIVMLCQLEENEKEMSVCYWPTENNVPETYGKLTVKKLTEESQEDFVWRKFEVNEVKEETSTPSDDKTSFTVTQFQFKVWSEQEAPPTTSSLIELIDNVNRVQMGSGSRPMIVMCNDGVGRTGTFICIHAQLERLKTEGVVDFFQFVKSARKQRPGVISVVSQYELCHSTVLQYLQSCEEYANFKDVM